MPTKTLSLPAGRGMRFVARLIDMIIGGIPFLLILPGLFALSSTIQSLQLSGMTEEEMAQQTAVLLAESGMMMNVLMALCGWLIIAIIQLVMLAKDGQTIGKKAMSVKIVMLDTGMNGGFVPNVLLRTFVNGLLGVIPFYKLIDALFIFRADRRCLHDMIAHTTVIQA